MNKILFALCAGIVLTGFSTIKHKKSYPAYKSPDLAMFELRGNVKYMDIEKYYAHGTDSIFIICEEPTCFSSYTFDTEGRLTDGYDQSQGFIIDYSQDPAGRIKLFSVYNEEDDLIGRIKRDKIGAITRIIIDEPVDYDSIEYNESNKPGVGFIYDIRHRYECVDLQVPAKRQILSTDNYGNPTGEKGKCYTNGGYEYTLTKTYRYEYDTHGNWTSRITKEERRFKDPQTNWDGSPASICETHESKTVRVIKYYD